MNFKDAGAVQDVVQTLRLALQPVMQNRTRINALMNGNPPWTEEERNANRIYTNVPWLEGQLDAALLKPGRFFRCTLDRGPREMRQTWSEIITEEANRLLKRSRRYKNKIKSTNAQVVLHGIGPSYWPDSYDPVPKAIGVDDVMVPSRTLVSLENLEFFGIYREWTYSELHEMTSGENKDPGWNMKMVKSLLGQLKEMDLQPQFTGMRWLMPEKLEEDLKENSGWFYSSAAPTIFIWDFYCRRAGEDNEEWERKIVLDCQQGQFTEEFQADAMNDFLYDSAKRKKPSVADEHSQIAHWQFGNCSNVAPFRYYSVRSLGYLLYAVCRVQDMIRNRFTDATFESLLTLFRNISDDDREKLEQVDLYHMGTVPDGLSFVTAAERHEVNENLVMALLSQNRQLMSESSASYLPDVERGGRKTPETATAEMIRLNTSVALTSAMLGAVYDEKEDEDREVMRRFCLKGTKNKMAKDFQERVKRRGVPAEILDIEWMNVEPERVLGGGNQAMEVLQADRLMQAHQLYDPQAQRKILRIYTLANTSGDSDLADELVPMQPERQTQGTEWASAAFGNLMQSLPVQMPREASPIEVVETWLAMAGQVTQQLPAIAQAPEGDAMLAEKISGVGFALTQTAQLVQLISQDQAQVPRAKRYEEVMDAITEQLKPFVQELERRAQEKAAMGQGPGVDPKTQAAVQAKIIMAQTDSQIQERKAAQKEAHKDASFYNEAQRRNAQKSQDLQEQVLQTQADIAQKDVELESKVINEAKQTEAKIQMSKAEAASKPKKEETKGKSK
jgi:hypothetical protein